MENEIVNRVAKSPIITFDLEDLYQEGPRLGIDISKWLHQGLVLIEKKFREAHKISENENIIGQF